MGGIRQMLHRLLIGGTLLYCVGVLGLALLWNGEIRENMWLELANIFAPHLFAPLLLLLPAALFVHSRWFRGAVLGLSLTFLVLAGPSLIPASPGRVTAAPHFRIATWNVLYKNRDIASIIATLRAQDADVITLQELTAGQANALQQQLSAEYPYQLLLPNEPHIGILSRYPFVTTANPSGPWRQVTLDLRGTPVTLINVHLATPQLETRDLPVLNREVIVEDYDTRRRARETAELLRVNDSISGPLIMAGDFNTSDREPSYTAFHARLHDAYRETAWGFGFTFPRNISFGPLPIPFPLVRIDYVWSGGGVTPVSSYTVCHGHASDHCMLVADLHLEGVPVAIEQ